MGSFDFALQMGPAFSLRLVWVHLEWGTVGPTGASSHLVFLFSLSAPRPDGCTPPRPAMHSVPGSCFSVWWKRVYCLDYYFGCLVWSSDLTYSDSLPTIIGRCFGGFLFFRKPQILGGGCVYSSTPQLRHFKHMKIFADSSGFYLKINTNNSWINKNLYVMWFDIWHELYICCWLVQPGGCAALLAVYHLWSLSPTFET